MCPKQAKDKPLFLAELQIQKCKSKSPFQDK